MKAEELRIGNIVNHKFDELEYNTVQGFDFENVYLTNITIDYVEYDDVEPIPLTKEWLIKLGFEVEQGNMVIAFNDSHIKFQIHSENNITYKLTNYSGGFRHIYYVHQLQNLYHSLTGKELTIKE